MNSPADGSLSRISYSSYWRQLGSLRPSPAGMLVSDETGRVVWTNDELPEETRDSVALLLEPLIEDPSPNNNGESVSHFANDSYHLHAVPVRSSCGDLAGLIGVVLPCRSKVANANARKLEQALCAIAESIARERDLLDELDTMAAELALRYEELNLFYNIAYDGEAEQSECEQVLSDLLHACALHLESCAAAIILPKQKIEIFHVAATRPSRDVDALLQSLKQEACPWLIAHRRPMVINKKEETLHAAATPSLDGKLVACPVLNELGGVCGLIALTRPDIGPDFTTGDRRLLEVVAKKAEKVLHLSHDALTGLINRSEFIRYLERSLSSAHSRGSRYCLLVVEVNHLKTVNDAFGHEAGDALLRYVGDVLRGQFNDERYVVSRIGGDHFAVLIPECSSHDGQDLARELAKAVTSTPFCWRESRRNIAVSIGLAVMDRHTQRPNSILHSAEIACDVARGFNTDRVAVYNGDDPLFVEKREDMRWVGLIQDAILNDRFKIYCQKIEAVDGSSSGILFNEVLLRLADESGNIFRPKKFLPAAERFYLMPEIDRWVIRSLFEFLSKTRAKIERHPQLWSINLSGQTLSDDGFLGFVTDELSTYGIHPETICFEITETAAVTHIDRAQRLINSLRAIGCRFSLDDFGTGLSSFSYLKSLRVDHLKIDGSFVHDVLENKTSEAVVSSIIHLGHVLGTRVIAEWVENDATRLRLKECGINFVQGYGVGKPLAIDDWLRDFPSGSKGV